MYDLLKKYDKNFTIDINQMVMDNVYIASKMPVELISQLTTETIDHVIEENCLSDSLEKFIPHIDMTPEHFEVILQKEYMSDCLYSIMNNIILSNKENGKEILIHILRCYGSNLYKYISNLKSTINDFIVMLSSDEIISSKNFEKFIMDNYYITEESYKHDDLALKIFRKCIDTEELWKIKSDIKIWDLGYVYYKEFFDNVSFVEMYIKKAPQEHLVHIDEDGDRDYFFLKYLKANHIEAFENLLKWHSSEDMVANFLAYEKYGNFDNLTGEELIELLTTENDIISNSHINNKIYMRVLNSPYIMGKLLENGVFEIWFLHHNKEFTEIRNLLANYYINHPKDYSHANRFVLESVIIKDYFTNKHINAIFKKYVEDDVNLRRVISDMSLYKELNLKVILDANPKAITMIGDLNKLYTEYLCFYKKDDDDF